MTAVLQSRGLGKRYRQRWALTDCTLRIPAGNVVGLVGPIARHVGGAAAYDQVS